MSFGTIFCDIQNSEEPYVRNNLFLQVGIVGLVRDQMT